MSIIRPTDLLIRRRPFGPRIMNAPAAAAAAATSSLALTDTRQAFSTGTTYTIAAASIGDVAANRVVFVTIAWLDSTFGGATVSAMTVGGVTASRVVRAVGNGNFNNAEIWQVAAGTGSAIAADTTADIVMTISRSVRMTTAVYRAARYSGTAGSTGTGTTNVSATIAAGGMALVICCNVQVAAASISNVTEDYNSLVSGGFPRGIHGSKESVAGESLTSTFSSTTPNATKMAAAAFPAI